MSFTPYIQKALLDWVLQGATPARPGAAWVQWATQSPNWSSAFDGPYSPRQTVSFAAANSPTGSKTNLNAITGRNTAAATAVGFNIYDSNVGGTRLAYGTLTASIAGSSGDQPAFAAGGLVVVLS